MASRLPSPYWADEAIPSCTSVCSSLCGTRLSTLAPCTRSVQVEHEKREEEMKSQEARMLNQQRLRKAMFASRISSRLMSPPGNRPPKPWAAEDSSAVADEDADGHASTESGYER
eukprot:6191329-Pleurochrysis_carterae.AAC.1